LREIAFANPSIRHSDPGMSAILVAVTGLSPAIVTETVWALAREKERVIPGRVVFITTVVGAERIREQLFSPVAGFGGLTVWESLRAAVGARDDELMAEPARIIGQGNRKTGMFEGLADIVTPEQNDLAAGFILEQVRQVVTNPETRLIASIAGGRKTMGALLHAAVTYDLTDNVQIFGRLENALDVNYQEVAGFQSPGIGAYAGVKLSF
jgi:CRISPR-associated protein (TIGR02584 family)